MNSNLGQINNEQYWPLILSWKELYCYLNQKERKQLSNLCLYLRFQLKPVIFELLHLDFYTVYPAKTERGLPSISSRENEDFNIDQLRHDLQSILSFPIGLSLSFQIIHPDLLLIPTLFTNLSSLDLYRIKITLDSLNQLLQQFNRLEIFKMHISHVIVWSHDEDLDIQLNLPQSIKSLNCLDNDRYVIDYVEDPYTKFDNRLVTSTLFQFPVIHLPNLDYLVYPGSDLSFTPFLSEFLSTNSHIKCLNVHCCVLDQGFLNLIPKCDQLNKLIIDLNRTGWYDFYDSEDVIFPKFNPVKSLEFQGGRFWPYNMIESMTLSCPNLSHLIYPYQINNKDLKTVLQHLVHLEKLTLYTVGLSGAFITWQLPRNRLKYIELKGFELLTIDFRKFKKCSQLARISILDKVDPNDNFQSFQSHFDQFEQWKYYIFPESVQFYKN